MPMRDRFQRRYRRLCAFVDECYMVSTPVANPLAFLNDAMEAVKVLKRVNAQVLKQGAFTSCEVARSVCKPVDDMARRSGVTPVYPRPTGYPPSGYPYPQYGPTSHVATGAQKVVDTTAVLAQLEESVRNAKAAFPQSQALRS